MGLKEEQAGRKTEISDKILNALAKELVDKKELRNLDMKFAKEKLNKALDGNQSIIKKLSGKTFVQILRTKQYKKLEDEIRKELREIYGMFSINVSDQKKENLLKEYLESKSKIALLSLLRMHRSTKERVDFYEFIYKDIFRITGTPEKILDLGCGYNPLSYDFLGCTTEYIATDISEEDCRFLQQFFDKSGITGQAFSFDLTKFKPTQFIESLKCDLCFMFKLADVLEAQKTGISKSIISSIPAKWFAVSFATKTLGGSKEIPVTKRKWFENFLLKEDISWHEIEVDNEIFYIFKNKKIGLGID
ncbi:hypothetical protein JW868_01335 [Candidatus Woesearchaeota archaeon]|nr:hypothetical protein [Candidatus Woesearchaeota archaeon]